MENEQRQPRNSFICYRSFILDEYPEKDQAEYLLAVARYALNGTEPKFDSPYLRQQWKSAKPVLDAAYTNWLNAKDGGAPKGNQNAKKQPKNNPNVNAKENINENVNLSEGPGERESQRERERIFEKFFFRNFMDPTAEVERYWGNYAGQGWQTSKGQPITDRVAYSSGWKPQDERPRFAADILKNFEGLLNEVTEGGKRYRLLNGLRGIAREDSGRLLLQYGDREAAESMADLLELCGKKGSFQVQCMRENNRKTTSG